MRNVVILTLSVVALCALADRAAARAPTLEELPTVKEMLRRSDEAVAAAREKAAAAARDPKMDQINGYKDGTVSLYSWKDVADILKSGKEEAKYRQAAAEALRARFRDQDRRDARMAKVKKEIAVHLRTLLMDDERDVRVWVAAIFKEYFPGDAGRIGYDPNGSYRDRNKAYKEWQKTLRK